MIKTFTLLFHILKFREKNGKTPIYVRITVNKKRAEIAIKRTIEPAKWDIHRGYMKGTSDEAKSINAYIDIVRSKIYEHHKNLIHENKPVTALALKNAFLGISVHQKTLVEVFNYHNKQMKGLVGKEFAVGTYTRYETTLRHLKDFLKWKYNRTDILLNELNFQFITELDYYFRAIRNCNNNSTVKYIKNLRKVINSAVANEWLTKDPFAQYKGKIKEVEKPFLSKEELEVLHTKAIDITRLEIVRDIFLFSCYTGLAYIDVSKLSKDNLVIGIDGEKWIKILRTKTETPSNIPLLNQALQIIEKHADYPKETEKLLPMMSNQKINAYLKEIAVLCDIKKPLTFHIARHTFATTVTLSNGVSMESVSKMLGHKSLRTTQHYAKIIDRKVGEDMQNLKLRLEK